jgi:Uma2 family endonuclease
LRRVLQKYNELPDHIVGEIIKGTLYKHLGPTPFHDNVSERIYTTLVVAFQLGLSEPGGWYFRKDPLLDLKNRSPRVKPDVAGWRLENIPQSGLHDRKQTAIEVRPDWVCEVLSKKTRVFDTGDKKDFYAESRIPYYWIVDPRNQSLEVWALQPDGDWKVRRIKSPVKGRIRLEPFQAVEIDFNTFWEIPQGFKSLGD